MKSKAHILSCYLKTVAFSHCAFFNYFGHVDFCVKKEYFATRICIYVSLLTFHLHQIELVLSFVGYFVLYHHFSNLYNLSLMFSDDIFFIKPGLQGICKLAV